MQLPTRAIGYTRLSDLRKEDLDDDGNGKGLIGQEGRIRKRAAVLGWTLWRIVVENDLSPGNGKSRSASAFKRRKIRLPDGRVELRTVRPGFRAVLDDLAHGRGDGLIALDLDRAVRDPRDLEDLIDVVEQHHVPVESVTGSLRLANDADITMARVMVAMANKSSRDTARRVSDARENQATRGRYGGGRRPYAFESDGLTLRPTEAAEVAGAASALLSGVPLRQIARDMRERGVQTVSGAPWSASTLRDVMLRSRNAAIMIHKGEEVGPAPWPAIITEDVHRAVVGLLTDPGRTTTPGNAAKWLGSGIYRCVCGETMRVHGSVRYRCVRMGTGGNGPGHVTVNAAKLDSYVESAIKAMLSRADAARRWLADPAPGVDVAGLRTERSALRQLLDNFATDRAEGLIDRRQMIAGTERVKAKLADIDRQLESAASGDSPLKGLIEAEDVDVEWSRLPLGTRRAVLAKMALVVVGPSTAPRFDYHRLAGSRWIGETKTWGQRWAEAER